MAEVIQIDGVEIHLGETLYLNSTLVQLSGDLAVGSLLSRIVYWHRAGRNGHSKLRVHIEGCYWIAKTRDEWMAECCITEREYRRGIATLKDKGIIEVRKMRYSGLVQSHIRLHSGALSKALGELSDGTKRTDTDGTKRTNRSGQNVPLSLGQNVPADRDVSYQPLITENTTGITTERTTSGRGTSYLAAFPKTSAENSLKDGKGKKTGRRGEMKVEEILQNQKNKSQASIRATPAHWQYRLANHSTGMLPALKRKEIGQLGHFARFVKSMGQDPNAVIDYVIDNWAKFAIKVRDEKGFQRVPSAPQVGFLLEHYAVAVNLLLQSIAKTQAPVIQPKQTPKASKEQPPTKPDADVFKPTPEQLAEILAGLG